MDAKLDGRRRWFPAKKNNFVPRPELVTRFGYYVATGCWCGWTTKMRIWGAVLIFSAAALPCAAQTILKSEPLVLAPYEVAFVQDVSCPVGKVLKVTGAIRGLHRKKVCVVLSSSQASLATATP
ncbi:MAG: hypothetical protein WBF73_21640 [Bradyrhizobium sp.]